MMRTIGTVLQLAGLVSFTAGATLEYGWSGLAAAAGIAAVYVGLAVDRGGA